MHRVELKEPLKINGLKLLGGFVPNAPCGVESLVASLIRPEGCPVPNAPCGVERASLRNSSSASLLVPNAPCGVES